MLAQQHLISIILPTFNRGSVLPRAITSVLNQSYQHWELIIIDDGSTDDTEYVVQSFLQKDERIQFHKQKNEGPSSSRNKGLQLASGYYATYLDSDDEYLFDHIRLRVVYMLVHPDIKCMHGGIKVIGTPEQMYVADVRDQSKKILIEDCFVGGTFFGLREIFLEAGGWKEGYSEDSDLFMRISSIYPTAKVDYKTYIYHRDSNDSRCDSFDES